jgi:hypothetical protein
MRAMLGDHPNVRIVNLTSGYDTGEMYSQTHKAAMDALRTRGVAPRTASGGGKGGGKITRGGGRAMGALGVFGDLLAAHEFGKTMASDDPYARAQFLCDFTGVAAYCAQAQPPQLLS